MTIKLINLGRDNVNKEVTIKKPSFKAVYKEIKKHLLSKYPDIITTEDPHTFDVYAGFRHVGQIWVDIPNLSELA